MSLKPATKPAPAPALESVTRNPAPNFDRLAGVYRWMELFSFGPFLHRARCAFLTEIISAPRALILGDGDGRFTAELLQINPRVQIDAVDASPAMLEALVHRAGPDAGRVRTHAADARTWLASKPGSTKPLYDLVVTHFFLDCLTSSETRALSNAIRLRMAPDALWLISDFSIPPGLYGRLVARPVVQLLYRAFGMLTGLGVTRLPDHPNILRYTGFTLFARKTMLGGLLVSEIWQKRQRLYDSYVTNVLKSAV